MEKQKYLNFIEQESNENKELLQSYYPEYQDLINLSVPIDSSSFKIKIREDKMVNLVDFNICMSSDYGRSMLWMASSVNEANRFWHFLEYLTLEKEDYCYYCEEEGPETFFYVLNQGQNNIRFIHITNREQCEPAIRYEEVKIRQDVIIDKTFFIKTLYIEFMRLIKNTNPKEVCLCGPYDFDELNKDSEIIKEYLKIN